MFKAKDIMTSEVITVDVYTPIYDAISVLVRNNITGLLVLDEDMHLAGVLSEKDVLKLLYNVQDHAGAVEEFMTPEVVQFDQEDSLLDICDCFIKHHFRRVPIMHNGKLVGVISRRDIIRYITQLRRKDTKPE